MLYAAFWSSKPLFGHSVSLFSLLSLPFLPWQLKMHHMYLTSLISNCDLSIAILAYQRLLIMSAMYAMYHLVRFQDRRFDGDGEIKGPDNPTKQLLPIMSTKSCSGDGEGRKDKGGGGGPRSKTKLCVTKLYVKDGV